MIAYSRATQHLVPYATRAMNPRSLGLVLHVQQGNNSLAHYFANPAVGAMSHFWIAKDGRVEQYQSADRISWAQAAGNGSYHSVETEGFTTEALSDLQLHELAYLYRWGVSTLGWPLALAEHPGQAGLGWHGMGGAAWGGHTGCPGDLRKTQRVAVLALLAAPPATSPMLRKEEPMIFRVKDGPSAGWEGFDYGWGLVNINQTAVDELVAVGVKVCEISNSTFQSYISR